jgi:predicted enzyme related to lactoylglutathione lyase
MSDHLKINYIEIPTQDIKTAKEFFSEVFGWMFVDYGPDYCSFTDAGIGGGFYRADKTFSVDSGCPLIVMYSSDLEKTRSNVENAGGAIVKPIFSFPGGRRFHFTDPNGNEYAVWSE